MTKINFKNSFVILVSFLVFTGVKAQFDQTAKIVSDNRESRAEYGTAVALTENFAAVGASRETIASGAAYIYNKDNQGNWSYSQRLVPSDPNEGAEYGGGIKFSTDFLVVAAGRADVAGTQRAGALYVYDYINDNWEFGTKLIASDMTNDAKLGMNPTSMDVYENTIAAGAPGENAWTGSVYIFTRTGGTWSQSQKILSPTPQASDVFGVGVAISGDYLVVGANEVDGRKGAAYVYLRNGSGQYEFQQTLMASDAANDDFFGTSVSLSGDQLVIGAYGANQEQGAAYIFERDGQGNWIEVQKVTGNTSSESTQFGWSTSIQHDNILVSAPHIFGFEAGEVYHYNRNSSGAWEEIEIIQGGDTVGEDFYGWNVGMYQDEAIVGAPWEDHDENGGNEIDRAGAAYIFKNPTLLGVSEQNNQEYAVHIYPNPSSDIITVESNGKTLKNIQIFSLNGGLLKEINNIEEISHTFEISQFAKSIYFMKITFRDGETVTEKILKQ